MKYILRLLFIVCSLALMSASCKKKPENPIDQLPPATQEGKNTFGCLVNGKIFLPKRSGLSTTQALQCYYQYINSGYYLGLSCLDTKNEPNVAIYIQTDNLPIEEGKVYSLSLPSTSGHASGKFTTVTKDYVFDNYLVNTGLKGELKITYLDNTKQIVSGTFWFDAVNDKGEKVEVREGRFDMQFTK